MSNPERKEFKEFVEKLKRTRIIEKNPLNRIILFGSYYPPSTKNRLKNLQQALKSEGYNNTWLVENYPTFEDLGLREKSLYCLEFADINFFLVTFGGEKSGFTVEL